MTAAGVSDRSLCVNRMGVQPLLTGGWVLKIYTIPSFSPIQFFQRTFYGGVPLCREESE